MQPRTLAHLAISWAGAGETEQHMRMLTDHAARNPADMARTLLVLARIHVAETSPAQAAVLSHEEKLRKAHAAYYHGYRSADVVAGEREYQRNRKRDRRKKPATPVASEEDVA